MSPQLKVFATCANTTALASEKHVFHGDQLTSWIKRVLNQGESCLAFLCGANGSGKSHLALQASYELGASACLVSDDLFYEDHNALPQSKFTQALDSITPGQPVAIIHDDINADISDFASKVVLGLGAGISVRHIAWFVLDKGLPEAQEVNLLRKNQSFSLGPAKAEPSALSILGMVRKVRETFYWNGELVDWSEAFISSEMLKSCWNEILDWDAICPRDAPNWNNFPIEDDCESTSSAKAPSGSPLSTSSEQSIGSGSSHSWSQYSDSAVSFCARNADEPPMPAKAAPWAAASPKLNSFAMERPSTPPRDSVVPQKASVPVPESPMFVRIAPAKQNPPAPQPVISPMTCPNPLSTLLAQCVASHQLKSPNTPPLAHTLASRPSLSRPLMMAQGPPPAVASKPSGLTLGSVLNGYMKGSKTNVDVPQCPRF